MKVIRDYLQFLSNNRHGSSLEIFYIISSANLSQTQAIHFGSFHLYFTYISPIFHSYFTHFQLDFQIDFQILHLKSCEIHILPAGVNHLGELSFLIGIVGHGNGDRLQHTAEGVQGVVEFAAGHHPQRFSGTIQDHLRNNSDLGEWLWVKTKRNPVVHIKIAGIYGWEHPTNIDNNRF